MKKSTEVMMVMNKLVKLPELQKTMMEMSREMERTTHPAPRFFLGGEGGGEVRSERV